MLPDISKFRFSEIYNNSKGKTTLSLICAHMMIVTACIGFFIGAIRNQTEVIAGSLAFATLGTSLLGIRRFTQDKPIEST